MTITLITCMTAPRMHRRRSAAAFGRPAAFGSDLPLSDAVPRGAMPDHLARIGLTVVGSAGSVVRMKCELHRFPAHPARLERLREMLDVHSQYAPCIRRTVQFTDPGVRESDPPPTPLAGGAPPAAGAVTAAAWTPVPATCAACADISGGLPRHVRHPRPAGRPAPTPVASGHPGRRDHGLVGMDNRAVPASRGQPGRHRRRRGERTQREPARSGHGHPDLGGRTGTTALHGR